MAYDSSLPFFDKIYFVFLFNQLKIFIFDYRVFFISAYPHIISFLGKELKEEIIVINY